MKKNFILQTCIQEKQLLLYAVLTQFTSYFFLFFFTIHIAIATYFIDYKYINHDKKQLLKKD